MKQRGKRICPSDKDLVFHFVDVGTSVISEFYTPPVPKGHDFLEEIKRLSNSNQDKE